MATETLRPNANGDETNVYRQYPNSTNHYDKLDESSSDGDSTYIWEAVLDGEGSPQWGRDLYGFSNLSISSGQIDDVTLYATARRWRSGGSQNGQFKFSIKSGGSTYDSASKVATSDSYSLFSQQYTTNPKTSAVWTIAGINAAQFGVNIMSLWDGVEFTDVRVTQLYAIVTYVPFSDIGLRIRTSSGTIKIGVQDLDGHKLRIRKGGTTYGIPLLATNDSNASGLRIWDGAVKALPKVN